MLHQPWADYWSIHGPTGGTNARQSPLSRTRGHPRISQDLGELLLVILLMQLIVAWALQHPDDEVSFSGNDVSVSQVCQSVPVRLLTTPVGLVNCDYGQLGLFGVGLHILCHGSHSLPSDC